MLDRDTATTYAVWFRALADPTRVQILNLLAITGRPMTVGEVVEQGGVGQSPVPAPLKTPTEGRFVLAEPRGPARLYRVNERCLTCFPTAADVVMGRPAVAFADVACGEATA